MTKVVHDTDIGSGLEISGGKLKAAGEMATDVELVAAIQASETADATEEQKLLENVRLQEGLSHNAMWELRGHKVKAHTVAASGMRFLSISSLGFGHPAIFYFPQVGDSVPSLQGGAALVVDAQGFIELPDWGVLWYKHAGTGQGWYWSEHLAGGTYLDPEYIRVFAINSDEPLGGVNGVLSNGHTIVQGRNYPDTNWIPLAPYYAANISNYGNGYQLPRFRRLNNRVYVEGLASIATLTTKTIGVLPDGFRPALRHVFPTDQEGGTPVRVDVSTDGVIYQSTAASQPRLSLEFNFGLE